MTGPDTILPLDIDAPWGLRFDRDGTEDVIVICDAEGYDLARSRPLWLPEGDDPDPPTLAAMVVMLAAPNLLTALIGLADQVERAYPVGLRSCHLSEALQRAREAIAEATRRIELTGR